MHYHLQSVFPSTLPMLLIISVYTLSSYAQIEVVSITPSYPHDCVNTCVFNTAMAVGISGINEYFSCDDPVANR